MGIESMRGMVPRNAGCGEHQRWKCPMLRVENSLSVQAHAFSHSLACIRYICSVLWL